ncbi:MAG: DNA polymerase I [Spirochaetia bacterium]|nr:DNA polymerase I [Spirochaetia bacterium]
MSQKKQFLLVDGYALIYRSYFAFINRPVRDSSGRNVSAVFGFFRTLFALLKEYKPEFIAVAMDSKTPTFRHDMYPEYKATRDKTPDELRNQIPLVEKALNEAGVSCLRQDGLEADDLIATLAHNCTMDGMECMILTGDKDLMQLIGDSVYMLRPVKGEYIRFDAETVYDHLGVRPDQIVDYLSLIGDSSDNVPGVKGIGPKGAVKLLSEYGDLDTIYHNLRSIPAGTAKKLSENRDNAYLSRDLILLQKDADCENISIKDLAVSDVDWSGAIPVFQEIQSSSLVASAGGGTEEVRSARKGNLFEKNSADTAVTEEETFLGTLSGKGSYKTVESIIQLQQVVKQALENGKAAFDIETDSIDDMKAIPVGFSISWEPCKGYYIPLLAGGMKKLPEKEVKAELKQLLENPDMKIIGQNYKYDYKVLYRWGIHQPAIYFDTMIAAWLLDSTANAFNMDRLAETYLNYTTIKYSDVVPKGFLFPDIELAKASEYAAEDADVTYRLYIMLSHLIKKRGMENVMYHIEMPILKILADMELRGMRILPEQLKTYETELKERLEIIRNEIFTECGHEFNLNSPKQLQEVLFTERGLHTGKKTKTGFSTNVAVLEELARIDTIPGLILQHRTLEKLRNTYVEALPALINPDTGKLHTSLLQTGTATGRLSSKNPNLQNIPIRSEDGRRIRSAFVPSEGFTFLSADYSQIELVVLAHFSNDPGLKEAFLSGIDVHNYTGALIFGVDPEEVTSEQRRIAKTINFGVMYGMSAFRLSQELGITRSDAEVFIKAYFHRYSGVRKFIDTTIENAAKTGRVMTLLGHERIIPGIASRNKNERSGAERIAVNTPIQGTAADILKLAMIGIQEQMNKKGLVSRMILQVHDELIFEVPKNEIDTMREIVRVEMEGAVSLHVPLRVSLELGSSWGDLH